MKRRIPEVRFLEPSRSADVQALEAKINAAVREAKLAAGPIRLFRHDDGSYGFSGEFSALSGRKKDLDALYDLVMQFLSVSRKGRRRAAVRKVQAKFMITEALRRRIKERARQQEVSASELVERCLQEAV